MSGNRSALYCMLCNVTCSSAENYQAHIKGVKHFKKTNASGGLNALNDQTSVACNASSTSLPVASFGDVQPKLASAAVAVVAKEVVTSSSVQPKNNASSEHPFRCDICDVNCNSKEAFESHLKGRQHKHKSGLKSMQLPDAAVSATLLPTANSNLQPHQAVVSGSGLTSAVGVSADSTSSVAIANGGSKVFRCDACDVNCSGPAPYKAHTIGKAHKKKVAALAAINLTSVSSVSISASTATVGSSTREENALAMKDSLPLEKKQRACAGNEQADSLHCSLCSVTCPHAEGMKAHLMGSKHKKKASPTVVQIEFVCDVCAVKCCGQQVFEAHKNGAKHKKELERKALKLANAASNGDAGTEMIRSTSLQQLDEEQLQFDNQVQSEIVDTSAANLESTPHFEVCSMEVSAGVPCASEGSQEKYQAAFIHQYSAIQLKEIHQSMMQSTASADSPSALLKGIMDMGILRPISHDIEALAPGNNEVAMLDDCQSEERAAKVGVVDDHSADDDFAACFGVLSVEAICHCNVDALRAAAVSDSMTESCSNSLTQADFISKRKSDDEEEDSGNSASSCKSESKRQKT